MKNDEDVVGAVVRLIGAVGRRAATADPDQAVYFRMIRDQLDVSIRHAVDGWRSQGFSDAQIGRELGVTRQAVRQRWPRRDAGRLCGRVMVGSGTDTYDPVCELPAGHDGLCKSSAAIDQRRLRKEPA